MLFVLEFCNFFPTATCRQPHASILLLYKLCSAASTASSSLLNSWAKRDAIRNYHDRHFPQKLKWLHKTS
jgi:hypothetical protein